MTLSIFIPFSITILTCTRNLTTRLTRTSCCSSRPRSSTVAASGRAPTTCATVPATAAAGAGGAAWCGGAASPTPPPAPSGGSSAPPPANALPSRDWCGECRGACCAWAGSRPWWSTWKERQTPTLRGASSCHLSVTSQPRQGARRSSMARLTMCTSEILRMGGRGHGWGLSREGAADHRLTMSTREILRVDGRGQGFG